MKFYNLLKQEYEERKLKNSKYSLRAFSRDMNVSSAFTTYLLQGKKKLSEDRAIEIANNLGFNSEKTDLFLNLVRLSLANHPELQKQIKHEINLVLQPEVAAQQILERKFRLVSHWYTGAILELVSFYQGKIDPEIICQKLQISKKEAERTLLDLVKIGMLKISDNRYIKDSRHFKVDDTPSMYIKKFHRGHLDLAKKALDSQSSDERDITGITLSFNQQDLHEVKKMIREFRLKIASFSQDKEKNSIYHLGIQFIKLVDKL